MATTTTSKAVVSVSGAEDAVNRWLAAYQAKREAEEAMRQAEAEFLSMADEARMTACRRDGRYRSTVEVNGKIRVTYNNTYAEIPMEDFEKAKAAFGDMASSFFKEHMKVEIEEGAISDEVVKKIIEIVGAQNVHVKKFVKPTNAFHESRVVIPDVGKKADTLIQEGVIRPGKPTVKAV
jgi:hypothetical protein